MGTNKTQRIQDLRPGDRQALPQAVIAELLQTRLWPKLSCPKDAKEHKARVHSSPCPQAKIAEQCEMLFDRHFKPAGFFPEKRLMDIVLDKPRKLSGNLLAYFGICHTPGIVAMSL